MITLSTKDEKKGISKVEKKVNEIHGSETGIRGGIDSAREHALSNLECQTDAGRQKYKGERGKRRRTREHEMRARGPRGIQKLSRPHEVSTDKSKAHEFQ